MPWVRGKASSMGEKSKHTSKWKTHIGHGYSLQCTFSPIMSLFKRQLVNSRVIWAQEAVVKVAPSKHRAVARGWET